MSPRVYAALAVLALAACECEENRAPVTPRPRDAGNNPDAESRDAVEDRDAGEAFEAGVEDTGPADTGLADTGPPDSGADPAICAVGLADGCCPLALTYGGTDPDCPALDCATFDASPDVELTPLQNNYLGGAAIAYTGRELVLVYGAVDVPFAYDLERRDVASGSITYGPARRSPMNPRRNVLRGTSAMAYEPVARRLVWVAPSTSVAGDGRFRAIITDLDGKPETEELEAGDFCNPFGIFVNAVWPAGGRPLIFGAVSNCMSDRWLRVARINSDATVEEHAQQCYEAYGSSALWDGAMQRLITFWSDTPAGYEVIERSTFDPATDTFAPEVILPYPPGVGSNTDFEFAVAATDGSSLMVIGSIRMFQMFSGLVFQSFIGKYDPASGWSNVTILRSFGNERRLGEVSIVWTGSGYVAAYTEVDAEGSMHVGDLDAPRVHLVSVAPDGAVREHAPLRGEEVATVFAQVAWAGGRVAVTWVERSAGGQQHKLRWLSCP